MMGSMTGVIFLALCPAQTIWLPADSNHSQDWCEFGVEPETLPLTAHVFP